MLFLPRTRSNWLRKRGGVTLCEQGKAADVCKDALAGRFSWPRTAPLAL